MGKLRSKHYRRIIEFLEVKSPDAFFPKSIGASLRINHNTAKSYCARLEADGQIIKTFRGMYRAKLDMDTLRKVTAREDVNIRLHGIKLQGRFCASISGGHTIGAGANALRYEDNFRKTYVTIYESRKITITIHEKGKAKGLVEVFIKTSKNPMSITEFLRFDAYLSGLFPDKDLMDFRLIQVGLNCDYRRLRLDGIKNLKLRTFKNAWFQIYNKSEQILRIEGHLVTDITLAEALGILKTVQDIPLMRIIPKDNNDPMFN